MKLRELPIDPAYAKDVFGVRECCREAVANGMDAQLRFAHLGRAQLTVALEGSTLVVRNDDVSVTFGQFWVLGASESRSEEGAIGQMGEGGVQFCRGLTALGHDVSITSDDERWTPQIVASETYGRDVLAVRVTKLRKPRGFFEVRIGGITPSLYQDVRELFLGLVPHFDIRRSVGEDGEPISSLAEPAVLLQPNFAGRVYAKGVFVMETNLLYGYNLKADTIGRDRNNLDDSTIQTETGKLMSSAFEHGGLPDLAAKILAAETVEVESRYNCLKWSDDFCAALLEAWDAEHGGEALPFGRYDEASEAKEALLHGIKPVRTSALVQEIISRKKGSVGQGVSKAKRSIEAKFEGKDLTPNESMNLRIATILVLPHLKVNRIIPCRFGSDTIRVALGDDNEAFVAKSVLGNLADTLDVVSMCCPPEDVSAGQVLAMVLDSVLSGEAPAELTMLQLARAHRS